MMKFNTTQRLTNPWMPLVGLLCLAGASVTLTGCEACSADKGEKKSATDTAVLAKLGDANLTAGQFDSYLKFKRIKGQDPKRLAKVFDSYLDRATMAEAIKKTGKMDGDALAAELKEFETQMLISRYFDAVLDEKVSDEAVQNYYQEHVKEYEQHKVHVAHILIRTHRRMGEEERQAKLTAAREIYSKLSAGGDFAELAKKHSDDRASSKRGGDLGWVKEGVLDARFSKNVFKMDVGVVSEPFESSFGFHVAKVVDAPQTIKRPLRAVAGDIRHKLRTQAKEAERERLMALVKVEKLTAPKPRTLRDEPGVKAQQKLRSRSPLRLKPGVPGQPAAGLPAPGKSPLLGAKPVPSAKRAVPPVRPGPAKPASSAGGGTK